MGLGVFEVLWGGRWKVCVEVDGVLFLESLEACETEDTLCHGAFRREALDAALDAALDGGWIGNPSRRTFKCSAG